MLNVYQLANDNIQAPANFLRIQRKLGRTFSIFLHNELDLSRTFAIVALSTNDEGKRIRNTAKAKAAYNAVLRFMGRVTLDGEQARELADRVESLKRELVAMDENRWNIVERRLEDRIRMLAAKAKEFPINSPASKEITELMKAELIEFFEREKNPPYSTDRRSFEGKWRSPER